MTIQILFDSNWSVSIAENTADKIILWLAIVGMLVGVAFTILVGAALFRLFKFNGSLHDEVFFLLLTCTGVYSLARFLVTRNKTG
jgi:hypothetical protein